MKDAWPVLRQARSSDVLRQVSRPVPWIDVKMTQDQILRRLQMARSHMGCVRDGTAGPSSASPPWRRSWSHFLGRARRHSASISDSLNEELRTALYDAIGG